ncbi:hypothetical protein DV736_g2518, partial [Chaetothyriales sp. CBS 134916]
MSGLSCSPSPQNGFSMAQEAHNTEKHSRGWGNISLRGNKVSFVSAGHLVREELPSSGQEDQGQEAEMAQVQGPVNGQVAEPEFPVVRAEEDASADSHLPTLNDAPVPLPSAMALEVPEQLLEIKQDQVPDSESESESSSEEEMILFHGRTKQASETMSSTAKPPSHSGGSTPHKPLSPPSSRKACQNRGPGPRKNGLNRILYVSDEEEAMIQDYIANMAVDDDHDANDNDHDGNDNDHDGNDNDHDGNDNDHDGNDDNQDRSASKPCRRTEAFRFYKGAGDENAKVQTKSKFVVKAVSHQVDQASNWDSSDLDDFDELATTDEDIDEIGQVLRHRDRPSGAQYLVTPVTKGTDDAKWILHSKLTSSITATDKIRAYHETVRMRLEAEEDMIISSSDGDDDALDDIIDDIESEDAENAKIIARTGRMTDEQIARTFAKQEELGIGADQLVLFDGQEGEDDEDISDRFKDSSHFVPFSTAPPISSRARGKKNRRQRDDFPSAEAFADALDQDPYGGFDVMDFDRPSVRPKRKGKKNDFALDFNLSDDEFALHIKSQWQKDRDKKAARKQEKMDELVAQLIEAEERSHPAAIKAEIRRFLVDETDTLKLAPMASHIRAGVHRLAKSLKLDSRSVGKEGKGIGRSPVLTKTAQTPHYTIDTVWQVDALMQSRKFFSSHWDKIPKGVKAYGGKRGGGVSDASFRTGDIVGGTAPELGADNKGRAMLEKMGWTSGTGIGADGNKGRLLAVEQVVRRGRSGLG